MSAGDRDAIIRAADRAVVRRMRQQGRPGVVLWLLAGPGVLAMLGENDGPSMLSYAATGEQFGIGFFLPFTIALFGLAYVCQEMALRVGAVTGRGFGELVRLRFGPGWAWFGAADLVLTNLVTIVAEFVAIRIGLSFFGIPPWAAAALGITLVLVTALTGRYRRWERIVLGLAVFNALFLLAAVAAHPNYGQVGTALVTWSPLPKSSAVMVLLLASSTIGATVTPWMTFFQQSASADKGLGSDDLRYGRLETGIGAAAAAVFAAAAVITGAALTRPGNAFAGQTTLPAQLANVVGHLAGSVFAAGLVEAGAVALLTIAASTSYAITETLRLPHSFNDSTRGGIVFHGATIVVVLGAAAVVMIPGAPLLTIAVNANVLATVLLPATLTFLLMLAADRELMGAMVNRRRTTIVAAAAIGFIGVCATGYAIASFLTSVGLLPPS